MQGVKALKATGGNFAFEFEPQEVKVEAKRPDGAVDVAHVNVVAVVPYLVMKTAAMGRGKAKDAYEQIQALHQQGIGKNCQLFVSCLSAICQVFVSCGDSSGVISLSWDLDLPNANVDIMGI